MKRYSSLIRKLIDATMSAEEHNRDIVEMLRKRCTMDSDLVRITLMNAVCDPRVRIYADYSGTWKTEIRLMMENLADRLSGIDILTPEQAECELEEAIHTWLHSYFKETGMKEKIIVSYTRDPNAKKEKSIDDSIVLLDEMAKIMQPLESRGNSGKYNPADSMNSVNPPGNSIRQENDSPVNEDEERYQDKVSYDKNPENGPSAAPLTKTTLVRMEERFLRNIPKSMIALVRRIGRMEDTGNRKDNRFPNASKSDITGITTGRDLSCILPCELAMLSDRKTESVFLSNFTTGRLQMFASASHVDPRNNHQNGPVILCMDASGSMAGIPIDVSKVLVTATAIIAWREKRDVIVVKYADEHDYINLGHSVRNLSKLISFLPSKGDGGNDENKMFHWLFNEITPILDDYKTADILCISDFGWTDLNQDTLAVIEEEKKKGMLFYGLNVSDWKIDGGAQETSMSICDSVWTYFDGECREERGLNSKKS